jgi:drug/metabolite transporter (DMT)-like permease
MVAVGAGITWSLGVVTVRKADADTFQYLLWRSLGIIVVLEVVALFGGHRPALIRAFTSGSTMLVAHLGMLTASLGYVYALKTTSVPNAAFLSSLTPLVAAVLAWVVLRESMSPYTVIAIVIGLAGLVVMVWGRLGGGDLLGNAAALGSSVGFAVYAICVRSRPQADWSPVMPGYSLLMIAVCTVVLLSKGHSLVPAADDIALAMFHGGMFIVVGTSLFNLAARHLTAGAAALCAQSEMMFAPLWDLLLLSGSVDVQTYTGGAIILASVVFRTVADARRARRPAAPEVPAHAI